MVTLHTSALATRLVPRPLVSFVVLTDGDEVPAEAAEHIGRCGLRRDEFEVLPIGPAQKRDHGVTLASGFELIEIVADSELPQVAGGILSRARGRYIVLMDAFSQPRPGSMARMMMHFEQRPQLGAAVFTVHDPCGLSHEHPFPNIVGRCGTAFRRRALEQCGGPGEDWRTASAEYDLSARLLSAGWEIDTFDDLHVTTSRGAGADDARGALRQRIRDEIGFVMRYFPQRWALRYAHDWIKRYRYEAADRGLAGAYYKGVLGGLARTIGQTGSKALDENAFEAVTRLGAVEERLAAVKERYDCERMVLVDLSAGALAWWQAARKLGIGIVAIADEQFAGPHRHWRDIPIVSDADARKMQFDLAVIGAMHPRQAAARAAAWRAAEPRPVIDLFGPAGAFTAFAAGRASESLRTAARSA